MPSFLQRSRLLVAATLCSLSAFTLSCQKEDEAAIAPKQEHLIGAISSPQLAAAQQKFAANGYASKLLQKLSAKIILQWSPLWDAAFKHGNDLYVPLRFTESGKQETKEMLGSKRFLVFSPDQQGFGTRVIIYAFDNPVEAQLNADSPKFLTGFTGKQISRGLQDATPHFLLYAKGELIKQKATTSTSAKPSATNVMICTTWHECFWQSYCERNGQPYSSYTSTYSKDFCEEPTQEACGTDNWGFSWYNVGDFQTTECIDYPPNETPYLLDGLYHIVNPGDGMVIEIQGGALTNLAPAIVWGQDNTAKQKWQVSFSGTVDGNGRRYYIIRNLNSNKVLECPYTAVNWWESEGAYVYQADYTGAQNQQWAIEKDATSTRCYLANARNYMNIAPVTQGQGNYVRLTQRSGPDSYYWNFEATN